MGGGLLSNVETSPLLLCPLPHPDPAEQRGCANVVPVCQVLDLMECTPDHIKTYSKATG